MSNQRILVTGATGFIGSHILEPLLTQGFDVHAVSHQRFSSTACTWHACNLLDEQQQRKLLKHVKPAYLIHSAWYTEHGKFWCAPENKAWLNASKSLVKEFAEQGGQRVIGVGSCAEYDWVRDDAKLWQENDPCNPATLYGQTKYQLYQYLQHIAESGLSFSWARLFLTFGPNEPIEKLIPTVITSLLEGRIAQCNSGQKYRDFSHVRDIGHCLALLVNSEHQGAINLASGQGCTISEVTTLLAALLERSDLLKLGEIRDRSGEPLFMLPDLSIFESTLDYKFPALKQRLEDVIEWWRINLTTTQKRIR